MFSDMDCSRPGTGKVTGWLESSPLGLLPFLRTCCYLSFTTKFSLLFLGDVSQCHSSLASFPSFPVSDTCPFIDFLIPRPPYPPHPDSPPYNIRVFFIVTSLHRNHQCLHLSPGLDQIPESGSQSPPRSNLYPISFSTGTLASTRPTEALQ